MEFGQGSREAQASVKDEVLCQDRQHPGSVEGKSTRFQTYLPGTSVHSWPVAFRDISSATDACDTVSSGSPGNCGFLR